MNRKQKTLFAMGIELMAAAPIILIIWGRSVDGAAISVLASIHGTAISLISLLWGMNSTLRENNYMLGSGNEMVRKITGILNEMRNILKER